MPLDDHCASRQQCRACGRIWYHNSAPCVGGLPLDPEGRVLLGKRGIEPFYGSWNVIGGFLQYGEDPFAGLRREVKEELGVGCDIVDFVTMAPDIYGPSGQALLNIYFTVRLHSMEIAPQDDVIEARWFSLERLPEDIAFQSDRKALEICKMHLRAGGVRAERTYSFSGP
jgi:ADP-ribose pyrophosphatase YjhB (NUDIX family)